MRSGKVSLYMPRPFCVAALILTASFLLATTAAWSAEDSEILVLEAEGVGTIERQNLSLAKEKAVEDALAQSLKAAVNSVLPPKLPPKKYQEAWRRIAEQRTDFIQKYVISAESFDQTAYRVKVQAAFFVGTIASRLRALGYETVRRDPVDKEIALTVNDVRSYEEYTNLQEFLKRGIPCVREVVPVRFSWREVTFRLTVQGTPGCVTAAQLPFDVQKIADDEILGNIRHSD